VGIIKRQGIKGTLVSYIGIALGYINLMLIYPAVLEKDQIGLIMVMISVSGLFAVFCQLGMSNTAIRFFPMFRDENSGHRGIMALLLLIPVLGFILFLLFWWIFHPLLLAPYEENSPLLTHYSVYLLPLTFFMMGTMLLESWASIFQRITVPRIIREVVLKLLASCIAVLYFWQYISFDQFVLLFIATYALAFVMVIFYILNLGKWFFKPDLKFLNRGLIRQMAIYSLFIILGGVGSGLVTKVDQIMLSEFLGLESVAVYSIAMSIAVVIEIPMRALLQISTPIVAQAIADDDRVTLYNLYRRSSITQLIVGMFIFGCVWINADSLFDIMPKGDAFRAGRYVIFWIGLSKLFDLATSINGVIINNSKYYKVSLYLMGFLALLTIASNRIFIPWLGIVGAALATAISICIYNLLMLGFVYKKFNIQPFGMKTLVLTGVFVMALGVNAYLPDLGLKGFDLKIPVLSQWQWLQGIVYTIIYKTLVFSLIFCGLVWITKISPDLNDTLRNLLNRILRVLGIGKTA